jgi:hypothetical protein
LTGSRAPADLFSYFTISSSINGDHTAIWDIQTQPGQMVFDYKGTVYKLYLSGGTGSDGRLVAATSAADANTALSLSLTEADEIYLTLQRAT